jgi:hypothetical protein
VSAVRIVATARSKRRNDPSLAVVAALVIVAVLAGLVLGGVSKSEPPAPVKRAAPAAGAGVRLQLPAGWARSGASDLAGFERALWLRNSDEKLRAAVAVLPAVSPTLLPAALPAKGTEPETVRLRSGYDVWRYRLERPDGSEALVYAAPTTAGIATIACLGETGARACDRLASTVVVPSARRLELGKRAALFSGLPAVVSRLEADRAKGGSALQASPTPITQGLAADELARAHKTAASQLGALSQGEQLPAALTETASAYAALASAARARIPAPYAEAGRAVAGADADLRRALSSVASAADAAAVTGPERPASKPAGREPATAVTAPKKPSGGLDLTLPLLLLFVGVAGFFSVRQVLRQ